MSLWYEAHEKWEDAAACLIWLRLLAFNVLQMLCRSAVRKESV